MEKQRHKKRKDGASEGNNRILDDVYRTIVQKLPFFVIPVINEVFGTDYTEDDLPDQLRNEQYGEKTVITDSILRIRGKTYHIECQSTEDRQMVIRMFEYDTAIALESTRNAFATGEEIHVRFPHSAVLYVRGSKPQSELTAVVDFPSGESIRYKVPVIRVADFTVQDIFDRGLLMLLPYYILRYEGEAKAIEIDVAKQEDLSSEYRRISDILRYSEENERLDRFADIVALMVRVIDHVLREYDILREGVDEIMGGKVLELYSERLRREADEKWRKIEKRSEKRGEKRGEKLGRLLALSDLVKDGTITADTAAKKLGISVKAFKKKAML